MAIRDTWQEDAAVWERLYYKAVRQEDRDDDDGQKTSVSGPDYISIKQQWQQKTGMQAQTTTTVPTFTECAGD